jgi:hypothetical protein
MPVAVRVEVDSVRAIGASIESGTPAAVRTAVDGVILTAPGTTSRAIPAAVILAVPSVRVTGASTDRAIPVAVRLAVDRVTVWSATIEGVTGIPVAVRVAVPRSISRRVEDENHRVAVSRATVWLTCALTPVALATAVLRTTVASSDGTDGVTGTPVAVAVAVDRVTNLSLTRA